MKIMDHIERCKRIVSIVDSLSSTEQEELFRMIHKERYDYTRNNHGVFINLSWISDALLTRIEQYIEFCNRSQHELHKYESICDLLNAKMQHRAENEIEYDSDNKPNESGEKVITKPTNVVVPSSRISTSMRFYLLKKRFSKMNAINVNCENDLKIEPYVITS